MSERREADGGAEENVSRWQKSLVHDRHLYKRLPAFKKESLAGPTRALCYSGADGSKAAFSEKSENGASRRGGSLNLLHRVDPPPKSTEPHLIQA